MAALSLNRFLLIALISSAFFTFSRASSGAESAHDEKHFTYGDKEAKGPENWGTLKPEWNVCQNGKLQSPIDMTNERVTVLPSLGALQTMYKAAPATIINRGHDISVSWKGDAGGVMINGTFYKLAQIHWHSPSEHTVNGTKFALECHIVHMTADGRIAVIGVHYKIGRASKFLEKVLSVKSITEKGTEVGIVHPREMRFNRKEYYRYIGSLTTPPCTEGVIWTLVRKVKTVSLEQLHTLRQAVDDGYENNARPVQEVGDRPINVFTRKN